MNLSNYSAETLHEIRRVIHSVRDTLKTAGDGYIIISHDKGCRLTAKNGVFDLWVNTDTTDSMNLEQLISLDDDLRRWIGIKNVEIEQIYAATAMADSWGPRGLLLLRNVQGSTQITYGKKTIKLSATAFSNWIITLYEDGRQLGSTVVAYYYGDPIGLEGGEYAQIQREINKLISSK